VGVHHGLSVVLLSNAYTSDSVTRLLRAEIVEFVRSFSRRVDCRRSEQASSLSASRGQQLVPSRRRSGGSANFLWKTRR